MLAVQSTPRDKTVTPNILPCTIKHNGPVSADSRYWNPTTEQDGTSTTFFRGRKLRGKQLTLPAAYKGVVLQKTDKKVIAKPSVPLPGVEADDANAPKEVDTMAMEQHATFTHVMVWDHEAVPGGDDVYVKGMEEWIDFAEAVCSHLLWYALAQPIADSIYRYRCIPTRTPTRKLLLEQISQANCIIQIPQMGSIPLAGMHGKPRPALWLYSQLASWSCCSRSSIPAALCFNAKSIKAGDDGVLFKPVSNLKPKPLKQSHAATASSGPPPTTHEQIIQRNAPRACFILHQTPA